MTRPTDLPERGYTAQTKFTQELLERCEDRNYIPPTFVSTVWGYRRALCSVCGKDMMLQAYLVHYVRRHVVHAPQDMPILDDMEPDIKPLRVTLETKNEPEAWRLLAKANHASILAKYGKRMVK